jgi:hypothetical protein
LTEPPDPADFSQDSVDEPFDAEGYEAAVRAYEAAPGG